jgi:hypothetical protein
MLTSLSLSYLGITRSGERLFEDGAIEQTAPEEPLFQDFGEVPAEGTPAGEETPAAP